MNRSIYTLGLVAAASVFACESQPVSPQHGAITDLSATRVASPKVTSDANIISFETMYGVDEGFVDDNSIRGVLGDELPWVVGSAVGSLTTDGHLTATVRGIVFADVPEVPPELRGINDEPEFRGLVSCLISQAKGNGKGKQKVATVNITTEGFRASKLGNSDIDAHLDLPDDCVAPIIFIIAGSEEHWFAVTGAETSD